VDPRVKPEDDKGEVGEKKGKTRAREGEFVYVEVNE